MMSSDAVKYITFVVPSYNSAAYLDRCIDSLLIGGDRIEIIIVDDGSTDDTASIADSYSEKFPDIVRVIHKANGGHGSCVNSGIEAARGLYFKVVDSDDRVDPEGYHKILDLLCGFTGEGRRIDMLISNYVYDKEGSRKKFVMKPKGLPEDTFFGWDEFEIKKYHFMLMHSLIYRTELLRECGLKLPEHTYYVDNIYAFQPLPYVKTLYYVDVDFYMYYIGREGQSVSEENLVKNIDQYIRVNEIMTRQMLESIEITDSKECLNYMMDYLEIIMTIVCSIINIKADGSFEEKKRLWTSVRSIDPRIAKKLRHSFGVAMANLPGRVGRRVGCRAFHAVNRIVGFN